MKYTHLNKQIVQDLSLYISDSRYREENYYVDDNLLASAALEWVVDRLKRVVEESCLNFDGNVCNLAHMDSHSGCMTIMKLLFQITNDEIYLPKYYKDNEFLQDEIW
jgi:hypothetical protein